MTKTDKNNLIEHLKKSLFAYSIPFAYNEKMTGYKMEDVFSAIEDYDPIEKDSCCVHPDEYSKLRLQLEESMKMAEHFRNELEKYRAVIRAVEGLTGKSIM